MGVKQELGDRAEGLWLRVRRPLLQMSLDFDLPAQLMLHTFLLYLRLEEHLERHDEMAFLLPSQVHISKLAFAQRTPNLKVINCEGPAD